MFCVWIEGCLGGGGGTFNVDADDDGKEEEAAMLELEGGAPEGGEYEVEAPVYTGR